MDVRRRLRVVDQAVLVPRGHSCQRSSPDKVGPQEVGASTELVSGRWRRVGERVRVIRRADLLERQEVCADGGSFQTVAEPVRRRRRRAASDNRVGAALLEPMRQRFAWMAETT